MVILPATSRLEFSGVLICSATRANSSHAVAKACSASARSMSAPAYHGFAVITALPQEASRQSWLRLVGSAALGGSLGLHRARCPSCAPKQPAAHQQPTMGAEAQRRHHGQTNTKRTVGEAHTGCCAASVCQSGSSLMPICWPNPEQFSMDTVPCVMQWCATGQIRISPSKLNPPCRQQPGAVPGHGWHSVEPGVFPGC